MDSWDTGLVCGTPWDVAFSPMCPLETKGLDGQLGHRASMRPVGERWDSMGCPIEFLGMDG